MASVSFVRGKWRALVRRRGFKPVSQSFDRAKDAHEWARKIEAEMDTGAIVQPDRAKLADLIDRWLRENPSGGRSKRFALRQMRASTLGSETLAKLTAGRIVAYARERTCGGATVAVDLSFLSALLEYARTVWGVETRNEVAKARAVLWRERRVLRAKERRRRPTTDELDRIKAWFDSHSRLPMRDIIDFAVASAMRLDEIARLRWADYDAQSATVLVRERKHPRLKKANDQLVPLLREATAIIERRPRAGELIFPIKSKTVSSIFPRACRACGVSGLRFHDLRHHGASRLFELGYQIPEVAMFTGHRDWGMLRRYTHLDAATLRRLA